MLNGWEVEVYVDQKGESPFRDWISSLDQTVKVRILDRINRIRDGNFGDYKILTDGIYELRFHFGAGYRVYYGRVGTRIILLLCGGDKSDQKKDIKKAVEYWKDYKVSLP